MDSTWLSVMPTSILLTLTFEGPLFVPQPAATKRATRASMPKRLKGRLTCAHMAACYRNGKQISRGYSKAEGKEGDQLGSRLLPHRSTVRCVDRRLQIGQTRREALAGSGSCRSFRKKARDAFSLT